MGEKEMIAKGFLRLLIYLFAGGMFLGVSVPAFTTTILFFGLGEIVRYVL